MSKLTDKFREKGVFNSYYFYGMQPYISYQVGDNWISSRWAVYKRGKNLGQAWYDHGCRTFTGHGEVGDGTKRTKGLLQAQRWASKKFGIETWARDPFGSYGEAEFVKQRVKELKA